MLGHPVHISSYKSDLIDTAQYVFLTRRVKPTNVTYR